MVKYVHSRVIDSKPSRPAAPCSTAMVHRAKPSGASPWKQYFVSRYQVNPEPSSPGPQLNMLV